jgi:hypothetical protein
MSTVADIITGIRYDLKDKGTVAHFSDADIMHYMNRFRIYIAKMMYQNQLTAGIKAVGCTLGSNTQTYSLFSLATDFYAEHGLIMKGDSTWFTKKELDEYISQGYEASTVLGTPAHYMILNSMMYFFGDIPNATMTASMYYYYLPAAFSTTTTSMPWGGLLDEFWREFVTTIMMNRDEYNVGFEANLFKQQEANILPCLVQWSTQLKMIPQDNMGSPGDRLKAFYE